MELKTQNQNQICIISIIGRLEASSAETFKKYFSAQSQDFLRIILNLSEMDFIDSTGLGVIVGCLRSVGEKSGKLCISELQSRPKMVFEITRATRIFDIFDNTQSAIDFFGN